MCSQDGLEESLERSARNGSADGLERRYHSTCHLKYSPQQRLPKIVIVDTIALVVFVDVLLQCWKICIVGVVATTVNCCYSSQAGVYSETRVYIVRLVSIQ